MKSFAAKHGAAMHDASGFSLVLSDEVGNGARTLDVHNQAASVLNCVHVE